MDVKVHALVLRDGLGGDKLTCHYVTRLGKIRELWGLWYLNANGVICIVWMDPLD